MGMFWKWPLLSGYSIAATLWRPFLPVPTVVTCGAWRKCSFYSHYSWNCTNWGRETHIFRKISHILQRSFHARMRWFFQWFERGFSCKAGNTLSAFTGHMVQYVWLEEETEMFWSVKREWIDIRNSRPSSGNEGANFTFEIVENSETEERNLCKSSMTASAVIAMEINLQNE